MAAEPILVDVEDEVAAIIERIRRSATDEVQLVLPARSRFGQSRFNFQLLRQYSTRLGKRVAIWSPDPAVQRLAEESGFGGTPPVALPMASAAPQRAQRPAPQPPTRSPFPGREPAPGAQPTNPYGAPPPTRAGAGPAGADRLGAISR